MAFPNATWISFLRKYGPTPANDNMYDETIEMSRKRAGVEPLDLPTPYLDACFELVTAEQPKSIVLTGTAGDGKTYYCRQLWKRLGGSEESWASDDEASNGIYSLAYGSRRVHLIKDLSEINKAIAKTTLARISKHIADRDPTNVYVIAANHGQLQEQWGRLLDMVAAKEVWTCIEDQLFDGFPDEAAPVKVFDLSARSAADSMRDVLAAILEHPRWRQCDDCELNAGTFACPITENRRRLRDGDRIFQQRLIELMELSSQNDQHVPIRQQLMLTVNILLGHADARDALMSCVEVPILQSRGESWKASPFGNALGENLTPRKRRNREIFEKLARLGLGHETSNKVDRLLTTGASDPALGADYQELVLSDAIYGGTPDWVRAQAEYLENGVYGDDERGPSFERHLQLQRQRLFFTLLEPKATEYSVWELSVYQNAATFLSVVSAVMLGRQAPMGIVRTLVRGLNRVFTGELVEVTDSLVIATAGSYSQSRTNLLYEDQIAVRPSRGESIAIVARAPRGVALRVQLLRPEQLPPVDLPLTALRFEFLMRVSKGALPSSFSLECYEDLLAFKARVLAALEDRRRIDGEAREGPLTLRFLDVLDDGGVRAHEVEVHGT